MMEDDDEDDLERSEFEIWYDDNFQHFLRDDDGSVDAPLEVELFYTSVYCPVMRELQKTVNALIRKQYPVIRREHRPAVLEDIQWRVDITGHNFLLELYELVESQKKRVNLHQKYPKMDEWSAIYQKVRKPRYHDLSFYDPFTWFTDQEKQELIEEHRKEADESFITEDKPRFEFFEMLQTITFKYFKAAQELDSDGWAIYNALLFVEYTDYEFRFEFVVEFIDYEFEEEDLKIPYDEYSEKLNKRISERLDRERRQINDK